MNEMIEKAKKFMGNRNNLFVLILAGVLLMVVALPVKKKEERKDGAEQTLSERSAGYAADDGEGYADWEIYAARLESRLEEALGRMEGAGEVKVVIALRSSGERIVEKDRPVSTAGTEEADSGGGSRRTEQTSVGESTVYETESGVSSPYVVRMTCPEVEGVLVMAEGAGTGSVSRNLSEAVQVLLGIEAHRIKILRLAGTK